METFKLNNGYEIPQIGFGVFMITDPDECEKAVLNAFSAGYRLIDTANAYMNERAVGRAMKKSGLNRYGNPFMLMKRVPVFLWK